MDDKKLTEIMDNIQSKVGKEVAATIQDDLGLLITGNTENLNSIKEKDNQIKELQSRNEKLVNANAKLFAQIPADDDPAIKSSAPESPQTPEEYDFFSAYDEHGNFKK